MLLTSIWHHVKNLQLAQYCATASNVACNHSLTGVECKLPRSLQQEAVNHNTHVFNLGLHHTSYWAFIVADIQKLILGADFLHCYNLLVESSAINSDGIAQIWVQSIVIISLATQSHCCHLQYTPSSILSFISLQMPLNHSNGLWTNSYMALTLFWFY